MWSKFAQSPWMLLLWLLTTNGCLGNDDGGGGITMILNNNKQDRNPNRKLQTTTCSESSTGTVTAKYECEDVCGVSGLAFNARNLGSSCTFEGTFAAEDEARALGCPNVGKTFSCDYEALQEQLDDGNLDVMCDFCTTDPQCTVDDRLFVMWTCQNVCGLPGLVFSAQDAVGTCDFSSYDKEVEMAAEQQLGCPNVGSSFSCPGFTGQIEREMEAGSLDVLLDVICDFCDGPQPTPSPTMPPQPEPVPSPTPRPIPLALQPLFQTPSPTPEPLCSREENGLRTCVDNDSLLECMECVQEVFSIGFSAPFPSCTDAEDIVCDQIVDTCKNWECGPVTCDDEIDAFSDCAWRSNPEASLAGCGGLACQLSPPPSPSPTDLPQPAPTNAPVPVSTQAPQPSPSDLPTSLPTDQDTSSSTTTVQDASNSTSAGGNVPLPTQVLAPTDLPTTEQEVADLMTTDKATSDASVPPTNTIVMSSGVWLLLLSCLAMSLY